MNDERIFVETSARLHFGVLDLRGVRGRWFGGIGTAAPGPSLLVSAEDSSTFDVHGHDADRAREFAERFLRFYDLPERGLVRVHQALPSHAGLGSCTQLALAVARALAGLHGIVTDVAGLARAAGRGQRSAIGTWTFAGGGLVVEGGRRPDRDECGPLLARLMFPETWRCVVVVPDAQAAINGAHEEAILESLPRPSDAETAHVAQLVLMSLLPAVADGDIEAFGTALTEVQEATGRWFAPAQGGTFAAGTTAEIVTRLREWGAAGVGQSSWGPAVYGVVDGLGRGTVLAGRVREWLGGTARVYEGPFRSAGARVWREEIEFT